MFIPIYEVMSEIEVGYSQVKFFDMKFDNSEAHVIRDLPEVK